MERGGLGMILKPWCVDDGVPGLARALLVCLYKVELPRGKGLNVVTLAMRTAMRLASAKRVAECWMQDHAA